MSEIFQSFGINFQAITDDPTDVGGRVRDSIVVEVGFPNIFLIQMDISGRVYRRWGG